MKEWAILADQVIISAGMGGSMEQVTLNPKMNFLVVNSVERILQLYFPNVINRSFLGDQIERTFYEEVRDYKVEMKKKYIQAFMGEIYVEINSSGSSKVKFEFWSRKFTYYGQILPLDQADIYINRGEYD